MLSTVNDNPLAESWRKRLERGEREFEVWREGSVTVFLLPQAIRVCAGDFMDLELSLGEVRVHVEDDASRLDWENGELDIDTDVALALVAHGVRVCLQDEIDDPLDESIDIGDWYSPSAA